ncbi:hypothetical protein Q3G72_014179 [Acer saccharum]|nr:hypothetical protein Q3G72_014179 [Acer saccharum]
MAPLVSLHHVEYLDSLFPNRTRIESLKILMIACQVDPNRILQQSIYYNTKQKWSSSISRSHGATPFMLSANNLVIPLQTFKTWRSWSAFCVQHVTCNTETMDGGSIKDGTMKIRVRKCRATDMAV